MLALVALFLLGGSPLRAQHDGHGGEAAGPRLRLGAHAVPLVTHAAPVLLGQARTEASLTQTMVTGQAALVRGRLVVRGILNLEALTLPDGEPNAGIWGEGFVDRRHPHTLLHELTATALLVRRPSGALSATAGRGFVPFGSDDPMARPFIKYPLNHHIAQVLERLLVGGALRLGQVRMEGAFFNGDEPTSTSSLGTPGRVGDSWAVRGTVEPLPGLELGASHARLASPEHPAGLGLDHRKTHASLRWERAPRAERRTYVLAEWARTDKVDGGARAFRFHSALVEAAVRRRGTEVALRLERTERPEEERAGDPFRTPFPHDDLHLMGITRWRVATLSLSHGLGRGAFRARPFAEGSVQWVNALHDRPAFVPRDLYGAERLWSLAVGARLEAGTPHPHRPGRYGASAPGPSSASPGGEARPGTVGRG